MGLPGSQAPPWVDLFVVGKEKTISTMYQQISKLITRLFLLIIKALTCSGRSKSLPLFAKTTHVPEGLAARVKAAG